jgi:ribosomal protein S5
MTHDGVTIEQDARDLLERIGVEDAQTFTAGDLAELANIIADFRALRRALEQAS